MEKVLSADERIKRAEEIYYKRKMLSGNREIARVNVNEQKKNFGLLKKTVLQITICIFIYLIIHLVQTTNYIFSDDVLGKAKEILSYDINFQEIYSNSKDYINSLWVKENKDEEIIQEDNLEPEVITQEALEEIETEEVISEDLTEEEQDIKYILENKSLIIPLKRRNYIWVWSKRIGQSNSFQISYRN